MINLEKLNRKSASPLLLRRPVPAPNFHSLFKIFQIPPLREVIKIYSTPFKRGGPNYAKWHWSNLK